MSLYMAKILLYLRYKNKNDMGTAIDKEIPKGIFKKVFWFF